MDHSQARPSRVKNPRSGPPPGLDAQACCAPALMAVLAAPAFCGTLSSMKLLLAICTAIMATAAGPIVDEGNPILAPGAKLEKLAGGFIFTEGPASDNNGNVYFTDQPNDRIMLWSVDGKLST